MNNYSFLCIRLKRKQKGFDMNKFIIILTTLLTLTTATKAMSYSQAREQALFLTDKMAYELNLNEEQYDAAYEVNLDYLMSINTYDDLYGTYRTQRNLCSTGNTGHSVPQHTSTARFTGPPEYGTLQFTPAIPDATTSTSAIRLYTYHIAEATAGTITEDAAGIKGARLTTEV